MYFFFCVLKIIKYFFVVASLEKKDRKTFFIKTVKIKIRKIIPHKFEYKKYYFARFERVKKGLKCSNDSSKSCHHIYSFRNGKINEMSIFIRSRNPQNHYFKSAINLHLFIEKPEILNGDNLESYLTYLTSRVSHFPTLENLKKSKSELVRIIENEGEGGENGSFLASYLLNSFLEHKIRSFYSDNSEKEFSLTLERFRESVELQGKTQLFGEISGEIKIGFLKKWAY